MLAAVEKVYDSSYAWAKAFRGFAVNFFTGASLIGSFLQ